MNFVSELKQYHKKSLLECYALNKTERKKKGGWAIIAEKTQQVIVLMS